ncbi:MAG: hypothetical protein H8E86_02805 [Planctomycetes bacterium]|nr:hypothetical protein [Planctomycetota bacterium]
MIKNSLFLILLLTGCATAKHQVSSNAQNWNVSFTPAPDEMPLNEVFEITSWVQGEGEIDSLRVDAAMPAHGHGMMTDPKTKLQPDGSFLTTGMLLHMPGDWEIYFDIRYENDIIERAQVPLYLKP